jgi:murein DD-endopeptidase MepM/ murein hydrolase activator NlpD
MSNKKQKFDILLVPHNSAGKVKKIKFSYSLFKLILILNITIVAFLILAVVYIYNSYNSVKKEILIEKGSNKIAAQHDLQKTNENLNAEIAFLKKRILKNFKNINDIKEYQAKIRSFMSIPSNNNIPEGGFLKKTDKEYVYDIESYAFLNDPELMIDLKLKSELDSLLIVDYENYISQNLSTLNSSIVSLYGKVLDQSQMLLSTPSIWPVRGWLSSTFGVRDDPFSKNKKFHEGLDIANNPGLPIKATGNGVVTFSGINGGYGNVVMIDHINDIQTRYGHLQNFIVKFGQRVKKGQIIGYLGNTGRSSGPHLHYEIRKNGIPVNPKLYIIE